MKDKRFLEIVENIKTVLIIASRPLDFDCLGSGLVLKKYLESLGKKVTLMWPGKMSKEEKDFNSFLPYFEEVVDQDTREVLAKKNFDLLILVDGANFGQFYDYDKSGETPFLRNYDQRVWVDHHQMSPEKLGTEIFKDSKASSTMEVILEQILPEDFIDKNIATLSYAALVGDTGNFQWNFSPKTLTLASMLLEKGAEVLIILDKYFSSKTKTYLKMLSYAIENVEYFDDLKTVFLFLPFQKLQTDNIDEVKLADLKRAFKIEISKSIQGYSRGIVIYETQFGKIGISARGNNLSNKISFPKFLAELGGNSGGHFHAAGAHIEGDFTEIKAKLLDLVKKYLNP